jgi:integrative and conjugative element protein (TIGR02256 family)
VQQVDALFSNPLHVDSRILVEPEVWAGLRAFRQVSPVDDEAGGILLGYRRPPHLHVVEFTTPAPKDRRSRYEFDRRDPYHQACARRLWKASTGKIDCLGEWHTHPENDPSPSRTDTSEWFRVLSVNPQARVFVIIGLAGDWVGLGLADRLERAAPSAALA